MAVYGIIAEFNPLHNGHKHLLDCAKAQGEGVVCALGGDFVQRGDTAVFSKYDRARAALACGADAVAEMPVAYSMSTAQSFALCGVTQLANAGCDTVIFGSETGDTDLILRTADILASRRFSETLAGLETSGETFAARREKAAALCGADISVLRSPNDNLGTEYVIAARNAGLNLRFEAVKRIGTGHNGDPNGGFASASYIRELLKCGKTGEARQYMPPAAHFLLNRPVSDIKYAERALLALLRTKSKNDFYSLPDISEGIENRLFEAVRTAGSLEELYAAVKSKRYTLARVRRLVLCAALGIDNSFFMTAPPYTRILGGGNRWPDIKKQAKSSFPVITRVSEAAAISDRAKALLETECRAADIYALSFEKPLPCGAEYKAKFIKI